MTLLKVCPNCGVAAIPYERTTKPKAKVWCNNCQTEYRFKDLK